MDWSRGKAYAQDLRDRVFAHADGGHPVGVVAHTLLVSVSYVSKVLSRRRGTGETAARPRRCHVPPKLAHLHQGDPRARWGPFRHHIDGAADLAARDASGLGQLDPAVRDPAWPRPDAQKKTIHAVEQDRDDVVLARKQWAAE